jgi:hypothetical protein
VGIGLADAGRLRSLRFEVQNRRGGAAREPVQPAEQRERAGESGQRADKGQQQPGGHAERRLRRRQHRRQAGRLDRAAEQGVGDREGGKGDGERGKAGHGQVESAALGSAENVRDEAHGIRKPCR